MLKIEITDENVKATLKIDLKDSNELKTSELAMHFARDLASQLYDIMLDENGESEVDVELVIGGKEVNYSILDKED